MLFSGHTTSLLRWQRHLPQLREVLRKAEFVSLDLELTGNFFPFLIPVCHNPSNQELQRQTQSPPTVGMRSLVMQRSSCCAGLHARSEKFLGVDRCYVAHAEGARGFMPVQLGLCAARRSGGHAYIGVV